MSVGRVLILICILLNLSCAIRKNLETPFTDPTNKPAVDDGSGSDPTQGTKYCKPDGNGKFDSSSINGESSGQNSSDGSAWAEGGGCISKSIRETWATFNNLEAMKFGAADSFSFVRSIDPKPDITHLYEITYFKQTIIGKIDWTIQWYHGFTGGTFEAPLHVNINYQRTKGTSNIPIWHGGIVLSKVTDSVTSIAIRNEFKARQASSANDASARSALNEMITNSRNGAPDWTRLNTGIKDNPGEPDAPTSVAQKPVATFCVKDKNGKYPVPVFASGVDLGVSWIKILACLPSKLSSVYKAAKNPLSLRWKNSSSASVTSTPGTYSYTKNRTLRSSTKWLMTWTYDDNSTSASFKIDPPTPDFPVWSGTLSLAQVEANVTEVEIDNKLLTDLVSQSADENHLLSSGLLSDLTAQAAVHP